MERTFEKEVFFRAPVERVWQALTTPEQIATWMGHAVEELDLRPDGRLKVSDLHAATLTVVEPPHRLGWLWDPENGTEPMNEIITLHAENGGTRLHVLSVTQGRWAQSLLYFGGNEAGWLDWLEGMEQYLETGKATESYHHGRLGAAMDADDQDGRHRLFIRRLNEAGPAALAGLQVGDTLLTWNGKPLDRVSTFWRLVWRGRPGETVHLDIDRAGAQAAVAVTLA